MALHDSSSDPAGRAARDRLGDVETVADRLATATGLRLPSGARGVLADIVDDRARELCDGDIAAYANATSADADELYLVYDRVSVAQTEFFRGGSFFDVLHSDVIPELARKMPGTLRFWSAGCATGEEAWSLAAVGLDALGANKDLEIWATDWSRPSLKSADAGRYRFDAAQQVPPRFRYLFEEHTGALGPTSALRRVVNFSRHNLVAPLPKPFDTFDLVLLCNVLIYFDAPVVTGVIGTIHDALRPGGLLCLGRAESLWGIEHNFEVVDVGHGFAYRRRADSRSRPLDAIDTLSRPEPTPVFVDDDGTDETVVAERVAGIQGLLVVGKLEAARRAAQALAADHAVDARSHYLLGATLERLGEDDAAFAAYGRSVYLEPDFVLAHLCRGGLHERRGDGRRARGSYIAAHEAFERSDAERFEVFLETLSTDSLGRLCAAKAAGS